MYSTTGVAGRTRSFPDGETLHGDIVGAYLTTDIGGCPKYVKVPDFLYKYLNKYVQGKYEETLDAYAEQRLEKRESIYESRRREPLGKPYSRGHVLPAQTKEPKFSFGVTSRSSESAKNLIYPLPTVDESAFTDQYIRSHGSWRPGEQKDRKYAWGSTGIDPNRHKFGKQIIYS